MYLVYHSHLLGHHQLPPQPAALAIPRPLSWLFRSPSATEGAADLGYPEKHHVPDMVNIQKAIEILAQSK